MRRPDEFKHNMPHEAFEEYLRICQEIYEDMLASGNWPWVDDSPISEDLLESDDK